MLLLVVVRLLLVMLGVKVPDGGGGAPGSGSIGEEVVLGVVLLAMVFSITSTGVSSCSSSAG